MIGVYIVGEDDVTRHVIYRILSYCGAGRFTVLMELPARGGEIKNKIPNFNQLAMKFPVILLTDLDADNCAPELKRNNLYFIGYKNKIYCEDNKRLNDVYKDMLLINQILYELLQELILPYRKSDAVQVIIGQFIKSKRRVRFKKYE